MSECLFCSIAAGEMDAKIVYEDEKVLAFADINPQAPAHYLVIPRRHLASPNEIQKDNIELAGQLLFVASQVAKEQKIAESGYRLVANCGEDGGQEVKHMHIHLLGGRQLQWPPG